MDTLLLILHLQYHLLSLMHVLCISLNLPVFQPFKTINYILIIFILLKYQFTKVITNVTNVTSFVPLLNCIIFLPHMALPYQTFNSCNRPFSSKHSSIVFCWVLHCTYGKAGSLFLADIMTFTFPCLSHTCKVFLLVYSPQNVFYLL